MFYLQGTNYKYINTISVSYKGVDALEPSLTEKKRLQSVPPTMPFEALSVWFLDIHVPPVALTEAQVVILYFFHIAIVTG